MTRNVLRNDGTGGDEAVRTQRIPADDRGVCTYCATAANDGWFELVFAVYSRPRIDDVREHAARPTEDIILQRHTFVDADVILDFAVIPHPDVGTDHDILPNRAVSPDRGTSQDMAEVPNLRSHSYLACFVDIRAFMDHDALVFMSRVAMNCY